MKRAYQLTAMCLLLLLLQPTVVAAQTLIPGGNTIGLSLQTDGVSIVEFSSSVPEKAGLKEGDVICAIDGKPVATAQQVTQAVEHSAGAPLLLTYRRSGMQKSVTLSPLQTADGWRLGIYVRDSVNGIGTVTYYDPENQSFGALGHGVNSGNTLLAMRGGYVVPSTVSSVIRGREGAPGALQGAITGRAITGEIQKNTPQGIFGTMQVPNAPAVAVATREELHTGEATIRSNVRGAQVEEFRVQICALYPHDENDRNLLIEVTDPELLSLTGGIVQGMSGSPILQNGKLIGAVTHVLIDDPTKGYGIFIENMLKAAETTSSAALILKSA